MLFIFGIELSLKLMKLWTWWKLIDPLYSLSKMRLYGTRRHRWIRLRFQNLLLSIGRHTFAYVFSRLFSLFIKVQFLLAHELFLLSIDLILDIHGWSTGFRSLSCDRRRIESAFRIVNLRVFCFSTANWPHIYTWLSCLFFKLTFNNWLWFFNY